MLLLAKNNLINQLCTFGEVEITGSMAMNLMSIPDIDIYVINSKMTKKKAIAVLNKFILSNQFRGHLFYDFTVHKHHGFPKGWYVGLKKRFLGKKWKIDIWCLRKNSRPQLNIDRITQAQRRKILALKNRRDMLKLELPAWYIYKAVIKHDLSALKILRQAGLLVTSNA